MPSNWDSLKRKIASTGSNADTAGNIAKTTRRTDINDSIERKSIKSSNYIDNTRTDETDRSKRISSKVKSNYIALDCEMVGTGLSGKHSALARCSMVPCAVYTNIWLIFPMQILRSLSSALLHCR